MSRKLKIAVWYNLPSGGAKRALHGHLTGLLKRGHTIEIWRPQVKQEEYLRLADLAPEHEIRYPEFHRESPNYLVNFFHALRQSERMVESFTEHSEKAGAEIDRGGFDLLFANTCMHFHAPFIGRYVKSMPKALYVQEPNRPLYEPMPRLLWLPPSEEKTRGLSLRSIKARGRYYVESHSAGIRGRAELENAQSYDSLLVNSFFSREALLRAYGMNSRLCYLGIDPDLFEFKNLPRENFVIGVGTIGPSKNIKLAVEAVGRVPKNVRPSLVWVGNMSDDVYLNEMVALAQQLDVDFQPKQMIPDAELIDLLNRAKASVYAPRLEPFGYAPLEANACGTPVIGVAEGGVRETVEHMVNGLLVEHDPDAMAAGIERLMTDEPLRANLGETAYRLVREKWTMDAANDRLEHELLRLV